ncbi:MAG TPA: ATP-binding cassette domain-containing protein, partial [Candidatus Kapabacteria bacterium]|nr:ATP-binding cassette domain-containing protein [Candidatus Kapabacteria bacterium]
MININNIHKSFGPKTVLRGINIDIPDNDILCIIGKSGCGKSVLIKIIVGLLEPDLGTVSIDGNIVSQLDRKSLYKLRRKFGFVFQSAALFDSLTVFENIVLGLYEHGQRDIYYLEQEAIRVLKAVGLLPQTDENDASFINEWKILKDKLPSDLSGGMKKRVGVARALVGNPEYIFYDEPTTGLDPVTSEQIDDLIAEAKQIHVDGLDLAYNGPLDAAGAAKIRAAKLGLYVWTVDKSADAKRMLDLGVDGI